MNSIALFLSPLALLLPVLGGAGGSMAGPNPEGSAPAHAAPRHERPELGLGKTASERFGALERPRREPVQNQVRIEGRVVIRISPSTPAARDQMMSSLPRRQMASRFAEVDHGSCVPIEGIVGVQPTADNRLLFLMRDRQVLLASVERGCVARSFYSDSYVERNEDGKICVNRDELRSRAGANCQIDSFRRLVAVSE